MKLIAVPLNKNGDYNRETFSIVDDKVVWIKVPLVELGDVTQQAPSFAGIDGECIHDLQHGSIACYTAILHVVFEHNYIRLIGNGWADELGYPWFEDETYPLLGGKTAKKLIQAAKDDRFLGWHNLFSGNMSDLYMWPADPVNDVK